MKHEVYYDSNSDAIVMRIVGSIDSEEASVVMEKVTGTIAQSGAENILADFSQSPNLAVDKQTRTIIQEAGKKMKFDKAALVGISPVTRMIAKIILVAVGKVEDSRFFKTSDEALAWLKGE